MMRTILFFLIVGCSTTAPKGKAVYEANCTSCHNSNPSLPGSIGPEIATTPANVIKSKVIEGLYPLGYTMKRQTQIMPRFPQLVTEIDDVVRYVKEGR